MRSTKQYIVIASLLLFIKELAAQQYPFVHYTPKDGLVNSRVRKAYQDSKGRMYFLTYGGLSIYDGARFRNYTVENGLAINMVNDVLEVGKDSILVALNTDIVHIIVNGRLDTFRTENNFYPLINHLLRSIDGTIYASCDDGLFHLRGKRFEKLPLAVLEKTSKPPYLGTLIEFQDYLIFTTNDLRNYAGLFLYNKKEKKVIDAFEHTLINFLGKDHNNRVWVSMPGRIAILDSISLQKGKLQFISPPASFSQLTDLSIVAMTFDEQNIWLNQRGKEIIRIGNNSLLRMQMPELKVTLGMSGIFIDKESNTWLCNDGAGVFKLINPGLQIQDNPFKKFIEFVSTFNDTTWYTTANGQLIRQIKSTADFFETNIISSFWIISQANNKLLVCDSRTVYEVALTGKNQTRLQFVKKITLPESSYFLNNMLIDPHGNLIAAIKENIGVWKNYQQIYNYPLHKSDAVEGVQIDSLGRLWITTRYKGLTGFSINPEKPSEYLRIIFSFQDLYPNASPRCMVIDKTGLIWLGTRNHGIIAYWVRGNELKKIVQFQRSNGLTDDFVTSLACDSANNIIVGTQTGLDRIIHEKNSFYIENITKSSNLFTYIKETWVNSEKSTYALTNTGSLLHVPFPVRKTGNYHPALFLQEVKLNGQSIPFQKNQFQYNENNLSVSVAAPTFIDEKQVQFSYLLEGALNAVWSEPSTNAAVNLVNLPVGDYRLRIKAFFPSTSYQPQELAYAFTITPPWWQTWWFRVMLSLALIGILILTVRFYYKRKLERQRQELEKQKAIEKERTRIATDMHDDLGAGLSRIKFLSETIGLKQQQQQPIEEDIGSIREYSHEMIDKMGEIVWALNEKNDSLHDLLSYTRSYAVEYLMQGGIDCKMSMPDNFPLLFVSGEFRRNIFLSVKEALHNVVKHAQANTVSINVSINHHLNISILDDGTGFDLHNIRPFRNGLTNMQKRIEEIGGTMIIKNENGTRVNISAPLPV